MLGVFDFPAPIHLWLSKASHSCNKRACSLQKRRRRWAVDAMMEVGTSTQPSTLVADDSSRSRMVNKMARLSELRRQKGDAYLRAPSCPVMDFETLKRTYDRARQLPPTPESACQEHASIDGIRGSCEEKHCETHSRSGLGSFMLRAGDDPWPMSAAELLANWVGAHGYDTGRRTEV